VLLVRQSKESSALRAWHLLAAARPHRLLRQVFEGTSGIDNRNTELQFTGEVRVAPCRW